MQTVTVLHTASAIMSITLLGITQLATFLIWSSISKAKNARKMESEKFQQSMGVAISELDLKRGLFWNV